MRKGEGGGGGRLHTIRPLRRWPISSARTAVSYVCYSSVSILLSTNPCDMYKSSLRHIHDPVLLSQDINNTFFFLQHISTLQHVLLLLHRECLIDKCM